MSHPAPEGGKSSIRSDVLTVKVSAPGGRDDGSDSHSRLSLSSSADQSAAPHFGCFLWGRKGFFLLSVWPDEGKFPEWPTLRRLSSPSTEPLHELTQLQRKSLHKQPAEVVSLPVCNLSFPVRPCSNKDEGLGIRLWFYIPLHLFKQISDTQLLDLVLVVWGFPACDCGLGAPRPTDVITKPRAKRCTSVSLQKWDIKIIS